MGILNCPLFANGEIVRMRLIPRPCIADIEFRDFQTFKMLSKPLPVGTIPRDIFAIVKKSTATTSITFKAHNSINTELVQLSKFEQEPPLIAESNITIAVQTQHALLRQALALKSKDAFEIVGHLLKCHVLKMIQDLHLQMQDTLLVNEGSHFQISNEENKEYIETYNQKSHFTQRLQDFSITATFHFIHQTSSTLTALGKAKFTVVGKDTVD